MFENLCYFQPYEILGWDLNWVFFFTLKSEDETEKNLLKWLVLGGKFGEIFGYFSKEGMEVWEYYISKCELET